MINRLKVVVFSLCLTGAVVLRADAQQTILLTADGGSKEGHALRQELQSLLQQESKLRAQLRISQDQMKPLYDQINQLVSEIKPLQAQVSQTDEELRSIHMKIEIDGKRLSHLPKGQ